LWEVKTEVERTFEGAHSIAGVGVIVSVSPDDKGLICMNDPGWALVFPRSKEEPADQSDHSDNQ
jgi:hypothetical protein